MRREVDRVDLILAAICCVIAVALIATGHEGLILPGTVAVFLLAYVVEPLLVSIHELGHALATVALTGGRAFIQIGDGESESSLRFSLGRVDVAFQPGAQTAHCVLFADVTSRRVAVIVALAGPAASLLAAVGLIVTALALPDISPFVFWGALTAGAMAAFDGVVNLFPFRDLPSWWPGAADGVGEPSDGMFALMALRSPVSNTAPVSGEGIPRYRAPSAGLASGGGHRGAGHA